MTGKLAGQTAWITGAGRGIGRAIALAYADEGANLLITSRTRAELETLASEIRARGRDVALHCADVRNPTEVRAAAKLGLETFGAIDILVNNAGIWIQKPFLDFSDEEWQATLDTNLTGIYHCTRAILPAMLERKRGRIVNIASMDGQYGFQNLVPQCAAKAGVIGFTKALAKELWQSGIAITAICPAEVNKQVEWGHEPASRPGAPSVKLIPSDIAHAAVYLASPAAEAITGVCFDIYGIGFLAS